MSSGFESLEYASLDGLDRDLGDLARIACALIGASSTLLIFTDGRSRQICGDALSPGDIAYCLHLASCPEASLVSDTLANERFLPHPQAAGDFPIRFYARVPLLTSTGATLGVLNVLDRIPRTIDAGQEAGLRALGRQAGRLLEDRRRDAERERDAQTRDHLAAIIAASPAAIFVVGADRLLRSWSPGAEALFGWTEAEVVGRPFLFVPEDLRSESRALLDSVLGGAPFRGVETRRLRRDGSLVDVSISSAALRDSANDVIGAMAVVLDITERKNVERNLYREREYLKAILDNLHEGVVACDENGVLNAFNAASRRIHGLPESWLPADQWANHYDLFHADGCTRMEVGDIPLFRALSGELVQEEEMVVAPKNSMPKRIVCSGRSIYALSGEKLGAALAMHDITERKLAEQQMQANAIQLEVQMAALEEANAKLEVLATRDALTGLANRRAFDKRLREERERGGRTPAPLSLILMDIDHFKLFNDEFGHQAGDEVLQETGALLRGVVRETDLAARYGGEEIAVIAVNTDLSGAVDLAERIRIAIETGPWSKRPITVSIGVSALDGCDDLIACADQALYQSKREGRNRVTAAYPSAAVKAA